MKKLLLLVAFIAFAALLNAHEVETHETTLEEIFHLYPSVDFLIVTAAIVFLIVIVSVYFNKFLSEKVKKIFLAIIVVTVAFSTLYLSAETVYINVISESEGPAHWHADYEIWVCGEKLELEESEGFDNKIGTGVFHHHNDNRIHIEGVVIRVSDVSLGKFFETIGGKFTKDALSVRLKDKTLGTWKNGDKCPNGKAGSLKLYVNNTQNNEMGDYVIAPYATIPPGDFIKIVFD